MQQTSYQRDYVLTNQNDFNNPRTLALRLKNISEYMRIFMFKEKYF